MGEQRRSHRKKRSQALEAMWLRVLEGNEEFLTKVLKKVILVLFARFLFHARMIACLCV